MHILCKGSVQRVCLRAPCIRKKCANVGADNGGDPFDSGSFLPCHKVRLCDDSRQIYVHKVRSV